MSVTERVRERVPVGDFVCKSDAGIVNRVLGLRVTVTERVTVTDLLSVTDRVSERDPVRERVTEEDFVGNSDGGTVYRALGLSTDRVRVKEVVGLCVKGYVAKGLTLGVTVTERENCIVDGRPV